MTERIDIHEAFKQVLASRDELRPADALMTDEDVMSLLGVGQQWLKDHRTRVEPIIPHIKLGRTIRYQREAVLDWFARVTETQPRWNRKLTRTAAR